MKNDRGVFVLMADEGIFSLLFTRFLFSLTFFLPFLLCSSAFFFFCLRFSIRDVHVKHMDKCFMRYPLNAYTEKRLEKMRHRRVFLNQLRSVQLDI